MFMKMFGADETKKELDELDYKSRKSGRVVVELGEGASIGLMRQTVTNKWFIAIKQKQPPLFVCEQYE